MRTPDTHPEAYWGHSANKQGDWQLLSEHLRNVAERAREYAAPLGWGDAAYQLGLLHDLGKYGDRFQARLRHEESGIDHWSAGAWQARALKQSPLALMIAGHHLGLPPFTGDELNRADPERYLPAQDGLRLSEDAFSTLTERATADGIDWSSDRLSSPGRVQTPPQSMLDMMLEMRMLFSALVDADHSDTSAHFRVTTPRDAPPLDPARGLLEVERYRQHLADEQRDRVISDDVRQARGTLFADCLRVGASPQGLFTLTAPTGTGKTLAMLAGGLAHAKAHGLRRLIFVVPYLSIIDQTAKVYRHVFADRPDGYLLEHHSQANRRDDPRETWRWDAPIIITTTVQLLESLFAHRPGACRKLHAIAESVLLFDEAQSLPLPLIVPTLAALGHLTARFRASVILATATQPAFHHLSRDVRTVGSSGWDPREIVRDPSALFAATRRVQVAWPVHGVTLGEYDVARALSTHRSALCIVNTKGFAHAVATHLRDITGEAVLHLSTNLCPAHRAVVLQEIKDRLADGRPCRVIATQCVEAGVDLDFPVVYRAMAPLDAITQAAGRCNRNGGRHRGDLVVFRPDLPPKLRYPDDAYALAAGVTESLLRTHGALDIDDPSLYTRYAALLYRSHPPAQLAKDLIAAISHKDFPDVAARYRLIAHDTVSVLVPYADAPIDALLTRAAADGLTGTWWREAQPYVVNVYRRHGGVVPEGIVPIVIGGRADAETIAPADWHVLRAPARYDDNLGVIV